ncbi:MAG: vanadium-dependent haloperoxidase [Sedimentisphaeraceae bacterium JB056]
MNRRYWLFVSFCISLITWADAIAEDEVIRWNQQAVVTMKDAASSPPKASRDLAIIHVAIFDALNSIDKLYTPIYAPWQPYSEPIDPNVVIAAAAKRTLSELYPAFTSDFNDLMAVTLSTAESAIAADNAIALGESVADIILAWRATDGWDAESDYVYDDTIPGNWRPSLPNYDPPIEPQWADLLPFGMSDVNLYMPPPPPALDSLEYADAFNEVKYIGSSDDSVRTDDQNQITEFWNDFPGTTASPAGKWNIIAQVITDQFNLNLIDNARAFALVNIALADAGIIAWRSKYVYDLWRPIDAIRLADTDGNPETIADPNWLPSWPSPAFPEYVSGHSTFSAAGAEMLASIVGTNDVNFSVSVGFGVLPGVYRSFDTIWAAAEEAGQSRIYGGIHFQFANIEGLNSGQDISVDLYDQYCLNNPCDLNRDNTVDFSDFVFLCEDWMYIEADSQRISSDINYDRCVDYIDFAILAETLINHN